MKLKIAGGPERVNARRYLDRLVELLEPIRTKAILYPAGTLLRVVAASHNSLTLQMEVDGVPAVSGVPVESVRLIERAA